MSIDITQLPFDAVFTLIDDIDDATINPTVILGWEEDNAGPYINDGTTLTLATELMVTASAQNARSGGAETMYLTGGSIVVGQTRQVSYTATQRGVPNGEVTNPPNSSDATLYRQHKKNRIWLVNESLSVKSLEDSFLNAVDEVAEQNNLLAASFEMDNKASQQRTQTQQDNYETTLTDQQNTFESGITTQQSDFEEQINSDFDNFTANQREITAIINTGDPATVDLSSGNWLEGVIPRTYAGVTAEAVTLSDTTYLELTSGTGVLSKNNTGFTNGAYPIAAVVADGSAVTSVTNYGGAYLIPAVGTFDWTTVTSFAYTDGLLTGFTDASLIAWTITYDSNGEIATVTDGTDTTTITRDSSGNLTNIT